MNALLMLDPRLESYSCCLCLPAYYLLFISAIVLRNIVLDILNNVGLLDPHRQLSKELDGWDIWNLDESNRLEELHRICDDFLEKLVLLLFNHLIM